VWWFDWLRPGLYTSPTAARQLGSNTEGHETGKLHV
jgi:hypothetical protein